MFDVSSQMALILAGIAGFSTIIGALVVLFTGKKSDRLLAIALGFASGVMLSAAFTDLLPEAEEYFGKGTGSGGTLYSIVFFAVGILLAYLMETLIPHHCDCGDAHDEHCCDEDISRLGIVTVIAICLHNFPEGIALFFAGYTDVTLGVALTVAIVLHNIPGGISIAMPVYYASGSKAKALLYTLIPSVVQPLGALMACVFLKSVMNDFVMGLMFAVVAGFLLFIALYELYPASRNYGRGRSGVIAMFAGVILMPLTHLFG